MIPTDKREAARTLFSLGRSKKEISRVLQISPKSVRRFLKSKPEAEKFRQDKIIINEELLRRVYNDCRGFRQRVYEVLTEEHGVNIGYSTLTRLLRKHNIGRKIKPRSAHVEDIAGAEMQHDTSPHRIKVGNKTMLLQCSSLYLRYSKMRYIQFYPAFNRFCMKCFFHEALTYWGYSAHECIIDNTNLAILHGTGQNAVFNPEMIKFAKAYGFSWKAHERGHANRKAGCERSFWTAETNFLPGRKFVDLEDLNHQARQWSERFSKRPQSKTKLIPCEAFENEKSDLIKVSEYISAPYQAHQRKLDRYGYLAFDGNYYWVPNQPGTSTGSIVILQYAKEIKLFPFGLCSGRSSHIYPLPPFGSKNQRFAPPGANLNPYQPRQLKQKCHEEEAALREMDALVSRYVDFVKTSDDLHHKGKFIRELYNLSRKLTKTLFVTTLKRALHYKVYRLSALERIARQLLRTELSNESTNESFENQIISDGYQQSEAYQAGRFSRENPVDFEMEENSDG